MLYVVRHDTSPPITKSYIQYLSLHPIPTVLSFLSSSVGSWQLRAKAVYALSGLCTHNSAALQQLEKLGGWDVFRSALEGL